MLFLFGCSQTKEEVDTIVFASKIYSCEESFEVHEAMAVREGKIVALGTRKQIESKYSAETVKDYKDQFVYPGLIDAHCHFYGYGLTLNRVDLVGTSSFDEVIQRVVDYAKDCPGEWITGRGWDQNDWEEVAFPNHTKLNILFPDRPVLIRRVDGHAAIANSKALELANITASSFISGGKIELRNGRMTGLLLDNAVDTVISHIPPPSKSEMIQGLLNAEKNCFEVGLTSLTDAGLDFDVIMLIDSLHKAGALKMPVYAMANPSTQNINHFTKKGHLITDRLSVRSFKMYADGALGSRGAKLKDDYCDMPGHSGLWVSDPSFLDSVYTVLYNAGFQCCTHSIGDSASHLVLQLYAKNLKGENDRRWRIEHSQVVSPEDRPLYSDNNIIPSVQPTHATSDMYWAKDRICEHRMEGAYAYQSLLEQNGWLPLGTDFPVEDIAPLKTFKAAVERTDAKDYPYDGFRLSEGLTRKQSLLGMTLWAARSNFQEKQKGSLITGKDATWVVLSNDLMSTKDILQTKVVETWLLGEQVH